MTQPQTPIPPPEPPYAMSHAAWARVLAGQVQQKTKQQ